MKPKKPIRKLLAANRSEIAIRIFRAANELGLRTVAIYSQEDRLALHRFKADEAYLIGAGKGPVEAYLDIDGIVALAKEKGVDAIHPGYGFLAENPTFARACAKAGITFVGPTPELLELLGDKTAARRLATSAGVPVLPGTESAVGSPAEARKIAAAIGYPVIVKAAMGGGGRGMRVVPDEAQLEARIEEAQAEARSAFGDASVFLEKYLPRARHLEVQILADHHGNLLHLYERDCSVQRRHQKVVEEAPSPVVTPELRRKMGDAAVRLGRAGGYVNAGTVEFLVDADLNYYFLEVNTRLQVEHPVTEQVTGLDLVKLQIAIAAGHRLPFAWETITPRGHSMEVRLYAEDPDNNFFPSPGKIISRHAPTGPGIRLDEGVYEGWTVPMDYDPLLSKLIAWGNSREETIARLRRALDEYTIMGIRTNVGLFRRILAEPEFLRGDIHTKWLDEVLARPRPPVEPPRPGTEEAALIAAALWHSAQSNNSAPGNADSHNAPSRWKTEGRRQQMDHMP